jgi:hypothetical protein
MKLIIIPFILFFLFWKGTQVTAQQASTDKEMQYILTVYGKIQETDTVFEEKHPLSNTLNAGWNTFNKSYTRIYEVSTCFSGQTVEILKPIIYNAVIKVDKFIRKAVNKRNMNEEEAIAILKHIFDCANVLATENDTQDIEKKIAAAKTPEDIILFFNNVILKYV